MLERGLDRSEAVVPRPRTLKISGGVLYIAREAGFLKEAIMSMRRRLSEILLCVGASACAGGPEAVAPGTTPGSTGATISASPTSAAFTAPVCFSAPCTVADTFTVRSSTTWTSAALGFGGLGESFSIVPVSGPVGSTPVVVYYRSFGVSTPPSSSTLLTVGGFLRFRTTTSGIYVDVPVTVTLSRP